MSTKQPRIKISQDRNYICKYCVGDRVIAIFRKYGVHKFEAEITEVCENMHAEVRHFHTLAAYLAMGPEMSLAPGA